MHLMIPIQDRSHLHHHQLLSMEKKSGRLKESWIAGTSTTDSSILSSGKAMMLLPGSHPATWRMPRRPYDYSTNSGQTGHDLKCLPELAPKEGATVTAVTFRL